MILCTVQLLLAARDEASGMPMAWLHPTRQRILIGVWGSWDDYTALHILMVHEGIKKTKINITLCYRKVPHNPVCTRDGKKHQSLLKKHQSKGSNNAFVILLCIERRHLHCIHQRSPETPTFFPYSKKSGIFCSMWWLRFLRKNWVYQ